MPYHLTLSHVGVFVTDMPKMVDFYSNFLGFAISDRGELAGGRGGFGVMTADPAAASPGRARERPAGGSRLQHRQPALVPRRQPRHAARAPARHPARARDRAR